MTPINEKDIIKAKLEIQEQALKSIIQEIHDNIGQILSLAKLHLGTLDVTKPKQLIEKTDSSKMLISKAIKDLRSLAKHLGSDTVNQVGLSKSIEYELSLIPHDRRPETALKVNGEAYTLTGEEELILFRIVQEVIQYLIRSSPTSVIRAEMQYQSESLVISLQGKEKNELSALNINENSNLEASMHTVYNRTQLIGASLYINSVPGKTTIIITLPCSNP